ncbi:hypothetical protein BDQ17DRAFT_1367915 [Cyathus striatus]|nr:hypothetical protein BDQ17DRAFT_1367915 [Cyathus striatus]
MKTRSLISLSAPELILSVLSYLDIPEILALRQTCSSFSQITRDPSLWMTLLRSQERDFPMPPDIPPTLSDIMSIEPAVKNAYRVSRAWLLPRKQTPFKFQPRLGEHLLRVEMFLDRWLLAVYTEGFIRLQDTSVTHSSADSLDPSLTQIYEISLGNGSKLLDPSYNPFRWLKDIYRPSVETVRAINPQDELSLWNGIVEIQFMGPYLLLFKTRSVEFYSYMPLIDPQAPKLAPLKHEFSATTFRGVSFSQVRHHLLHFTDDGSYDEEVHEYSLDAIAFDVIQGLYRYAIAVSIPNQNSPPLPRLEILLLGTFSMALNTHTTSFEPPRGTFNVGARGFISAHRLGNQGKRAVWVERKRGSTIREVQVWDHLQDDHFTDGPVEMDGRVVHKVVSYDLRDDIVHCTLGESTGRVVLGCRSGDIFVINCI